MCKSFVEIKDGKIVGKKGRFRKGHWVICLDCGVIQYGRNASIEWCRALRSPKNNESHLTNGGGG
jgi:hypothetical protein